VKHDNPGRLAHSAAPECMQGCCRSKDAEFLRFRSNLSAESTPPRGPFPYREVVSKLTATVRASQ
jgi:hypothetical protein